MVELTRARGVEAVVGDVQDLPFADGQFDCVVAAWMLYHVPDLDRGAVRGPACPPARGPLVAVDEQRGEPQGALGARSGTAGSTASPLRTQSGRCCATSPSSSGATSAARVTFPDREAAHELRCRRARRPRTSPTACRSSTGRSWPPGTSPSSSASHDPPRRADRAQARRRRADRRGAPRARARLHARRDPRLPDGRVPDGRLLQGSLGRGDARAHRRDDRERRDDRPRRRARPQVRRQALDRRRRRQDLDRRRSDRRRLRRPVREDERPRARDTRAARSTSSRRSPATGSS